MGIKIAGLEQVGRGFEIIKLPLNTPGYPGRLVYNLNYEPLN
jgi:hypothetical protein